MDFSREEYSTRLVKTRAAMDAILAGRHFPGLIATGDCLDVVAVETS